MNGADRYRGLRAAASPPSAHGARLASLAGAGAARGVCRLRWTQAGPHRAEESARGPSWRGGGRRPIPLGFVQSLRAGGRARISAGLSPAYVSVATEWPPANAHKGTEHSPV